MSKKIVAWSVAAIAGFVLLHVTLGAKFDLFNLDRERTPAAIFSSLQFIASGYALAVIFFSHSARSKKMVWGSFMVLFVLLGLDEISELHENAVYYLVKYVPPFPFFHSGTPMWTVFMSPIILGVALLFIAALREIYAKNRRAGRILIAGGILVVVALSLEFMGGVTTLQPLLPFFIPLEESAELLAGALFLWGFSLYAQEKFFAAYKKRE